MGVVVCGGSGPECPGLRQILPEKQGQDAALETALHFQVQLLDEWSGQFLI